MRQYKVKTKKGTEGHIYAQNLRQAKAIATRFGWRRSSVKYLGNKDYFGIRRLRKVI